jgi:hypothetical protein
MIAILIASMLCVTYCYQNDWEIDYFLSFVILPLTLVQITMFGLIGTNIDSVCGYSDTKNFKIILSVCGGFSAIPVFYSLYKIIKYLFPSPEEQAERDKKEEIARNLQLARHRTQEELDIKNENKRHKTKLELEQRELQRQNELIIQKADMEINEKKKLLEKRRVEDQAQKAFADQRLADERLEEKLEAERLARESSVNMDRTTRRENLRKQQLERERKQQDLDDAIKIEKLNEEKALQKALQTRRLKEMEAQLYYKDSDEQEKIAELQQQLSLKAIERRKEQEKFKLSQLQKQLEIARLDNATREQLSDLQKQMSDTRAQINELSPPLPKRLKENDEKPSDPQNTGTIAQLLDPDEHQRDVDCAQMEENLELMQLCDETGQIERQHFDSKRDTLSKTCQGNYTQMDQYQQICDEKTRKEAKCVEFAEDLNDPQIEDCKDQHVRGVRSDYKNNQDYAHCTDQHIILDKIIEKCKLEEKHGDDSANDEHKGPPFPERSGSVEATFVDMPKTSTGPQVPQRPQNFGQRKIDSMRDRQSDYPLEFHGS